MENYNSLTGTIMKKKSGDILNPLTGQYRKDDESTGKRWPSISERSDDNEAQEQEPEPEPVQKNSDSQWPSLTAHLTGNVSKGSENFEKTIPIFIEKSKDEQIVYGIVYEPDTVDSQGDQANAEEIRKAAYHFMETAQTFKVMHKGRPVKVKILESYIAPQDFTIAQRKIKKGSWVLVTRILDKKLWKDIKAGKYTGYSMAGTARVVSD